MNEWYVDRDLTLNRIGLPFTGYPDMRKDFSDLYLLTNKYLNLGFDDFAKRFIRMKRYKINRAFNLELKIRFVHHMNLR